MFSRAFWLSRAARVSGSDSFGSGVLERFTFRCPTPAKGSAKFWRAWPLSMWYQVFVVFGSDFTLVAICFGSVGQAPLTFFEWANSDFLARSPLCSSSGNFVTRALSAGSVASCAHAAAELFKIPFKWWKLVGSAANDADAEYQLFFSPGEA